MYSTIIDVDSNLLNYKIPFLMFYRIEFVVNSVNLYLSNLSCTKSNFVKYKSLVNVICLYFLALSGF